MEHHSKNEKKPESNFIKIGTKLRILTHRITNNLERVDNMKKIGDFDKFQKDSFLNIFKTKNDLLLESIGKIE